MFLLLFCKFLMIIFKSDFLPSLYNLNVNSLSTEPILMRYFLFCHKTFNSDSSVHIVLKLHIYFSSAPFIIIYSSGNAFQ